MKDDEVKAVEVLKRLENQDLEVFIPEVVFSEIEYVLTRVYQASREEVGLSFTFLVGLPNFKPSKIVQKAVSLFNESHLSMADCLIIAKAWQEDCDLLTFDQKQKKRFLKGV
jgi:predicted nucleic-acid-binding protein